MSKAEELIDSHKFGHHFPIDGIARLWVTDLMEQYGRLVQEAAAEELDDAILGGAARIVREMRLP